MERPIHLIGLSGEDRAKWPLDDDRQANWLHSAYSATHWTVSGRNGKVAAIDFDIPVAKGGRLPEHESLYRTAKEFAYWWREHPESRVKNGSSQALDIGEFLTLCCALTHRGIWSFAHITRADFHRIERDWLQGAEGLLAPSTKVKKFLARFRTLADIPDSFLKKNKKGPTSLAREAILEACSLTNTRTEQTRWEMDEFCLRMGIPASRARTLARPPIKATTIEVLDKRMGFLKTLHAYRSFIQAEVLTFQPVTKGIGKGSARKGKHVSKTPVVPSSLMFKLLGFSGEYISERRTSIKAIADRYERGDVTADAPERSAARNLQALYVTCSYLVIAALTARRPDELKRLKRNCLTGNAEDGYYIYVFIVKNLNKWIWLPVPPIVAEAINGLLEVSDGKADDSLFDYFDVVLNRRVSLQVNFQLRLLAQAANAVEYSVPNGPPKRWNWQARQTRRYISALFYWGYGGSIEIVQYVLRHANIGSARAYTQFDSELANLWSDDAARFARHIAQSVAYSEERLSGAMGEHLMKLGRQLHDKFQAILIVEPDRLVDYIEEILRRKLLVLVPKAWVICTCPATLQAAQKAQCRMQPGAGTQRSIGPDFERAAPSVCAGCFWAMMTEQNRRYAATEMQQLETAVASPVRAGTVFAGLEKANLAKFVQLDRKHGIKASLVAPEEVIDEEQ